MQLEILVLVLYSLRTELWWTAVGAVTIVGSLAAVELAHRCLSKIGSSNS